MAQLKDSMESMREYYPSRSPRAEPSLLPKKSYVGLCPHQKVTSFTACPTTTSEACTEAYLDNMAGYMHPIASGTGGLEFSRLQSEEIKRISVKRIHVTPALDSMFGPMPAGLHDPALGAIGALDAK